MDISDSSINSNNSMYLYFCFFGDAKAFGGWQYFWWNRCVYTIWWSSWKYR